MKGQQLLPKEEWIVREEAETNPAKGGWPTERSLAARLKNGLVLVDKPYGPTSHQISAWAKDLFSVTKTGHAGTLDPHVTGVLPIALGRGTKVLGALKNTNKEYVCLMEVNSPVDWDAAERVGNKFIGTIEQTPPKMAAVKRQARQRQLHYLSILDVADTHVLFRIGCEKGFYVRVFCEQFGQALGTEGWMTDLRRTQSGCIQEEELVYLQDLQDQLTFWQNDESHFLDQCVYPIEKGVAHLKQVRVKDSAIPSLCHGASLGVGGIAHLQDGIVEGDMVAVLSLKGELISLGEADRSSQEISKKNKGQAVSTERVFMERDVY